MQAGRQAGEREREREPVHPLACCAGVGENSPTSTISPGRPFTSTFDCSVAKALSPDSLTSLTLDCCTGSCGSASAAFELSVYVWRCVIHTDAPGSRNEACSVATTLLAPRALATSDT
jgi:hypothetical protein